MHVSGMQSASNSADMSTKMSDTGSSVPVTTVVLLSTHQVAIPTMSGESKEKSSSASLKLAVAVAVVCATAAGCTLILLWLWRRQMRGRRIMETRRTGLFEAHLKSRTERSDMLT